MPFEIVRNDIVNMQVDAIVNTVSRKPGIGYGVDAGIHKKAGPELLSAREQVGFIEVGHAAITPGFALDAQYVIHTVGPVWRDGNHHEERLLRECYENALMLAAEHHCESIAFPLLSAGNNGFPKPLALQTAINAISSFLMEHEMQIYLVVFNRNAVALSEKLFRSVQSYIDENYILNKTLDEYGISNKRCVRGDEIEKLQRELRKRRMTRREVMLQEDYRDCTKIPAAFSVSASADCRNLDELLKKTDASFSETLLKLIDRVGKTDVEIYKKANVDRKLFSKIRNNPAYKPSKATALAFAIALELNLDETKDLIGRAGYALTHSSKFDIIIEFFITHQNYDIFEINEALFAFDQSLLGA